MTVAWQGANADPTTATSDTSMVVTAPTGVAVGDLLLAFGGCTSTRTISAPAGWTERANDTDGTNRVYVWTRVADSSDAAAASFTFTASATFNNAVVSVHRVSGASTNAPTTAFGTGANSQTQTCPTLTTPSANCLVFWGCYAPASTSSTADKGTERVDSGNATSGCWMSQYTSAVAGAGSVTGAVITTVAFGAKRVYSVAIESAAGGTAYTLTAPAGSCTLSGQAAGLYAGRRLTAAPGGYTLSGQAAGLPAARRLAAQPGACLLAGQDAAPGAARLLAAGPGVYSLADQAAATLRGCRVAAGAGSYALAGRPATLTAGGGAHVPPAFRAAPDVAGRSGVPAVAGRPGPPDAAGRSSTSGVRGQ